jgi:hypothetical protein
MYFLTAMEYVEPELYHLISFFMFTSMNLSILLDIAYASCCLGRSIKYADDVVLLPQLRERGS